ncbi:MAG: hypothetical protein AAB445_03645 [Patescibacteria group bacterium]
MGKIWDEVVRAIGYLFVAGLVTFAWQQARNYARGGKLKLVLWKGFQFCAGIAIFASLTLGNPTCIQQDDPVYGGCQEYDSDGYQPTSEEIISTFVFYMILFYAPVVFGARKGNYLKVENDS